MKTITFGPFDGTKAWSQAEEAGFVITWHEDIEREQVVTIPSGIEDPVQEDATAWLSSEHSTGIVLFVQIPTVDEREYPGGFEIESMREFESRWEWPVWYEDITLAIPAPLNFSNSADAAIALIRTNPVGSFEMVSRTEALGIGRTGRSLVEVQQPPTDTSLQMAIETIASGVPLPDYD